MSQNSFPENVPDAKQGASDSVAAPGCVGVRGTRFRDFCELLFRMPLFWACMSLNLAILVFWVGKEFLPPSPFDSVEDLGDFFKFLFLWWTGSLPA